MFNVSHEIRGQLISTLQDIDGHRRFMAVVRAKAGSRQETARYGSRWIKCGHLSLESTGDRSDMEVVFAYAGSPDALDQPGGQDSGVWVWDIPVSALGRKTVEADWPPKMTGGSIELIGL